MGEFGLLDSGLGWWDHGCCERNHAIGGDVGVVRYGIEFFQCDHNLCLLFLSFVVFIVLMVVRMVDRAY